MHIARSVGNCWSPSIHLDQHQPRSYDLSLAAATGDPPRLYSFISESLSRLVIDEIEYDNVSGYSEQVDIEILGYFTSARVGDPFRYGFMWWVRAWDGRGTQYLGAVYLGVPRASPWCAFPILANPEPVVENLIPDPTGIASNAALGQGDSMYCKVRACIDEAWQRDRGLSILDQKMHDLVCPSFEAGLWGAIDSINAAIVQANIGIPLKIVDMAPFLIFAITQIDVATRTVRANLHPAGFMTQLRTEVGGQVKLACAIGLRANGDISITPNDVDAQLQFDVRQDRQWGPVAPAIQNKLHDIIAAGLTAVFADVIRLHLDDIIQLHNGILGAATQLRRPSDYDGKK